MLIHYSRQSKLILWPNKTLDDNQQSVNDSWFGKVKSLLVDHIVAQMKFEAIFELATF